MIKLISRLTKFLNRTIEEINSITLALILQIVFSLLGLLAYNYTYAAGDISEYLNNALRILNGELPYRDFWLLHPPGEVFFPALIYKLFGLNINPVLMTSTLIGSLIGTLSFVLAKSLLRKNFYALIVSMLVFFNGLPVLKQGRNYLHIYFLLLLLSVFFFLKYIKSTRLKNLFLCGAFTGLAFIFKFHEVIAVYLAYSITLLIYSDNKTKTTLYFNLGFFLIVSLASITLMDIWIPMTKQLFIENTSVATWHATGWDRTYLLQILKRWQHQLMRMDGTNFTSLLTQFVFRSGNLMNILAYHLLPFILVGISIKSLISSPLKKPDRWVILFFLLWGVLTFPKSLRRPDMGNLSLTITPLYFLLMFIFQKRAYIFLQKSRWISIGCMILIVSLFMSIPASIIKKKHFLTRSNFKIETPHGLLFVKNERQARDINNIISTINKKTREKDYIFVTPWSLPPLYALTNRRNSTYYDSLIDPLVGPSQEKQIRICNDLLRKNTQLIIHQDNWGIENKWFSVSCRMVQDCIEDNFELIERHSKYRIYAPKKKIHLNRSD